MNHRSCIALRFLKIYSQAFVDFCISKNKFVDLIPEVMSLLSTAQVFLLGENPHPDWRYKQVNQESILQDAVSFPFKTCYFARPDSALFKILSGDESPNETTYIQSILLNEITPNVFRTVCMFEDRQKHQLSFDCSQIDMSDQNGIKGAFPQLLGIIDEEIRESHLGKEKYYRDVKIYNQKTNSFTEHKINYFIRIKPKYSVSKPEPIFAKEIDWSHQWWVRGHWRKFDGIGKDRNGDYNTKGFTWVIPHLKGPETLPVVKKVRIF